MSRIDIGSVFLWAGGNAFQKTGQIVAPRGAAREGGEGNGYTSVRTVQSLRQCRDGTLRAIATNIPSISWYCTGNSCAPTIAMLETTENVTNLADYSERFDQATNGWSKTQCTISTNSAVAPDGSTTADTIIEDSSVGTHNLVSENIGGLATNLAQMTVSIYVKGLTRQWCRLAIDDGAGGNTAFAYFHIATNIAVGTTGAAGNGVFHRAWYEIVPDTEGETGGTYTPWVRLVVQGRLASTNTYAFRLHMADADNSITYTGDGVSGFYIWGAMMNTGPLSPYVEVATNGTANRGDADQFSIPLEIDPVNTTWYVRMMELGQANGDDLDRLWQWGGLTGLPRIGLWRDATPGYEGYEGFVRRSNADIQFTQATMTADFAGELEIAIQIDAAGRTRMIWSENGGAQSANAWELVGAPPWIQSSHSPQIDIGHVDDNNPSSTRIRDILVVRGNYSIEECRNFVDASA